MTIWRTLSLNTEPRSSEEPVVISVPPLSRPPQVSARSRNLSNHLQWWVETPVGGRPAAVDEHEGAGHVGAGVRGQVDDHAGHLVRAGPAPQDGLLGVRVPPVGALLDLGR